jgi:hypothetical protein
MRELCVFWQNPDTRRWYPVGMLTRTANLYKFAYTKGAKEANGFTPFGRMNDLHKVYQSEELFPLFANRVLARSRPEYDQYVRWIAAEDVPGDEMLILARTGGARATDSLMIYAKPEPNERSEFDLLFLCHGIRHLPPAAIERINALEEREELYPMLDVLNPFDVDAVGLRTNDPVWLIGYVPRFFATDIRMCVQANEPREVSLQVMRVNLDAPLQLRLLCRLTAPWPKGFASWSGPEFEPLARTHAKADQIHEGTKATVG